MRRIAMVHRSRSAAGLIILACSLCTAGCGGDGLMTVTGTVKYADGAVPTGELAMLRFTPAPDSTSPSRKTAEADIAPDGSFELMTYRPGDGIHAGDYLVSLTVREKYMNPKSAIPPDYARYAEASTTPLRVTVDSSHRHFDLVLKP